MRTALGLWADGLGEIRTGPRAPGEAAGSWGPCLGTWDTKGITEETPQRIGSAGAQGLEKARDSPRWGGPPHHCIFHQSKPIAEPLQYTALGPTDTAAASTPRRQATPDSQQALLADAGQSDATDVEVDSRARAQAWQAKKGASQRLSRRF